MKVAFIIRSTIYSAPGGDTVQAEQTASGLRKLGVEVDILRTNTSIQYSDYDLFHFFNIIRPADILYHLNRIRVPAVLTPILVDYSEYERYHRKGIRGSVLRQFSNHGIEYVKTIGRWVTGKDTLKSKRYIVEGQRKSMGQVLKGVAAILANSNSEERALRAISGTTASYFTVPNGIDPTVFHPDESHSRNDSLVISAARIEGIKNQLNLIRALNDTEFTLWLVGSVGPNHRKYDEACRREAAANIHFKGQVSQDELAQYYQRARIHALPSWFETCGLSSLEAAACGCNIVITEKGYTRDYFGEEGFYCDPSEPASIYEAVKNASRQPTRVTLQKRINDQFTWSIAATKTLEIYKQLVNR